MTNKKAIEAVKAHTKKMQEAGITSVLFAVQYIHENVELKKIPLDKWEQIVIASGLTESFKDGTLKNVKLKAKKEVLESIAECETVEIYDRFFVEKTWEYGHNINTGFNRGHAVEMILFNTTVEEILRSKDIIDGIYNGERVQVKGSIKVYKDIYNTFKNSNVSSVTLMNTVDETAREKAREYKNKKQ